MKKKTQNHAFSIRNLRSHTHTNMILIIQIRAISNRERISGRIIRERSTGGFLHCVIFSPRSRGASQWVRPSDGCKPPATADTRAP